MISVKLDHLTSLSHEQGGGEGIRKQKRFQRIALRVLG